MRRWHLLVLFLGFNVPAAAQTLLDSLVPQPRQAYVREQYSAVYYPAAGGMILLDSARPAWEAARALNAGLRGKGFDTLATRLWADADSGQDAIVLGVQSALLNRLLALVPDQKLAVTPSFPGAEGYVLDVMPRRVLINGVDESGLAYGMDSFLQLIAPVPNWYGLNPCRIIDAPEFPLRWFYYSMNIQVPANITKAKAVWTEALRRRLNGVQLNDSKFARLGDVVPAYYDSLASLRRWAADRRLEIIPGIMPFGYSNGLLYHDPDLASGLPVRGQRFVVEGDTARLVPRRDIPFSNGGFETRNGNAFPGYLFIDQPGVVSFADTVIKHSGNTSIRFENFAQADPQHGHGRISFWTPVAPFTQYHVRGWVRSEGLQPAGCAQVAVLCNKGYSLSYKDIAISSTTSGWTAVDLAFNTLEADTVGVYWGVWGATGGRIWWDDLVIEECAMINLIRREGAPLVVRHPRLDIVYTEGVDYDTLRDPLCGRVPWSGAYDTWHTPPTFRIRRGGALAAGDTVLASYYNAVVIGDGQVMITMSDPKVYDIAEREFITLDSLLAPKRYFFQHDEIRTMNWDEGDLRRGLTPGRILADNVNHCLDIVKRRNPSADVWVWSDMFDEYHNAVKANYYLVNGDLTGSADLIPKSLGIMNWNGREGIVQNSLSFFDQKGFRQMSAPYYDQDEAQICHWKEWTRSTGNFKGMMYTTWSADYSRLQAFGEYAWNHAPYIYHNPPTVWPSNDTLHLDFYIKGDPWDSTWIYGAYSINWHEIGSPTGSTLMADCFGHPGHWVEVHLPLDGRYSCVTWWITFIGGSANGHGETQIPLEGPYYFEACKASPTSMEPTPRASLNLESLSPNPVRRGAEAFLNWSAADGRSVDITVYDALGRLRASLRETARGFRQSTPLQMGALPSGLYYLRLSDGASVLCTTFVVLR